MDFSSIMNMFNSAGASDAAGSYGGNPWVYWAKAIQDSVIGQSAGFDAVKQNQESEPLALQATGSKPVEGATRGTYKYNFEGQVPFLQGLGGMASGGRTNDPLYKKDVDKITKDAQNNASGSNAALDTALNEDARKIAGVSEGGSKPQLFASSMPKDQSFNSMMDSFENLGMPMDSPKYRQGGMMGMLGGSKKDDKKPEGLGTGLDAVKSVGGDGSSASGVSSLDWEELMNWFGNLFGSGA